MFDFYDANWQPSDDGQSCYWVGGLQGQGQQGETWKLSWKIKEIKRNWKLKIRLNNRELMCVQVDMESPVDGILSRETFRTGFVLSTTFWSDRGQSNRTFLGLEDLLEPWLVKGEEESRFGLWQLCHLWCEFEPAQKSYVEICFSLRKYI